MNQSRQSRQQPDPSSRTVVHRSLRLPAFFLLLLALFILTTSCGSTEPDPDPEQAALEQPVAPEGSSPDPTLTPQPVSPSVILLAEVEGIDEAALQVLSDQLFQEGFELSVYAPRDEFQISGTPHYVLISEGLAMDLPQALSGIPVVSLGPPVPEQETPSSLQFSADYYQRAAFLAGYAAALQTTDYRTGFVNYSGSELGEIHTAYENGQTYYCGNCAPKYPPYLDYPVSVDLSAPFTQDKIDAVLAAMQQNSVETVYIHPLLTSPDLVKAFDLAGMNLVTNGQLLAVSDPIVDISVAPDAASAVQQLVPAILQQSVPEPVASEIIVISPSGWLSAGKLQHLEAILHKINTGEILPLG